MLFSIKQQEIEVRGKAEKHKSSTPQAVDFQPRYV